MNVLESKTYVSDLDVSIEHTVGIDALKGKTVLITGATGTIGSFVADMLLRFNQTAAAGVQVIAAGRNVRKLESRFGDYGSFRAFQYDLNSDVSFNVGADYIIHAAGNAHPAAFNGDPVGTVLGSVNSTYRLLEYGRLHGTKRLLYVSSGEVYGQGDLGLETFKESYSGYLDVQSPRSCYPMAKRAAENLCACYSKQYGFETVVVRPCHTYGPCITPSDNRANVQFIRNVLNGDDIVMKSAGAQMRSYNYVADCASAMLTAMIKGNSGEAYNIASPKARCTIAQLAEIIADKAGRQVVFAVPNAADLANRTPIERQVLSSEKITALGWAGAFSVEKGIGHTLRILAGR